jgi:hypothetical protein
MIDHVYIHFLCIQCVYTYVDIKLEATQKVMKLCNNTETTGLLKAGHIICSKC